MRGFVLSARNSLYRILLEDGSEQLASARGKTKVQKSQHRAIVAGDEVEVALHSNEGVTVEKVFPCKTLIERGGDYRKDKSQPLVANVDHALIVFASQKPNSRINAIDRYLVSVEFQNIDFTLVFNKWDLKNEKSENLFKIYQDAGYHCMTLDTLRDPEETRGKVMALPFSKLYVCGPSGVGKTTILNAVLGEEVGVTGAVNENTGLGRQTTTAIEFRIVSDEKYIVDTPGLGHFLLEGFEPANLKNFYLEFLEPAESCKYRNCLHFDEPGCEVVEQVGNGIHEDRYNSYCNFYDTLVRNKPKY